MPPTINCTLCHENSAILKRPKTGQRLCKPCFYSVFESEVHDTIMKSRMFRRGETVAIAASGGKDSTVLAHVMKVLNERHDYGLKLLLLSIDEGISGYRDDSLDTVRENERHYGIPLRVLSYRDLYGWSMDEIVRRAGRKNNCTFCGVFRRQALDRGAAMLQADRIVTGHNADDIAETVLMNVLRGDVGRLARCVDIITDTGASVDKGAVHTGASVDKGAVHTGASVDKGAAHSGASVDKGAAHSGASVDKGAVHSDASVDKGAVHSSASVAHVSGDSASVDHVPGDCALVDHVSGNSASVDRVSGDSASVDHVSGDSASVDKGTVHSGAFVDHVSVDSASVDHVSCGSTSVDHVSVDNASVDHVSVDNASVDHVSVDNASVDHVSVDNASVDHVSVDNASVDHVSCSSTSVEQPIPDSIGLVPRCKPLKYAYEKEIVMYAHYKRLHYFSTECVYSPEAFRGHVRAYIKDVERVRPSSIIDIIHSAEGLTSKEGVKRPTHGTCIRCGYISSQPVCKACLLLEGLNKGLPRLGIGKSKGKAEGKGKAGGQRNGVRIQNVNDAVKKNGGLNCW